MWPFTAANCSQIWFPPLQNYVVIYQLHTEELNLNRTDNINNIILMRLRVTIIAGKSSKYYIFSGIHHAKRMRHIILLFVAVWLFNVFRYYLIQTMIFGKKLSHTKCVSVSFTTPSKSLILRIIQRYIIINVHRSSCTVPVIRVTFYWNMNFLDKFRKHSHESNLIKIRQLGAELFHADGHTDGQTWRS